ncbi:MAG: FtsK/SpoIIIE domain-containing protein [Candidatus Promineifilaceae bacterium]
MSIPSSDRRLQHRLEVQSAQIERLFAQHNLPFQVIGGTTGRRAVSFDLRGPVTTGVEALHSARTVLGQALGLTGLRLERGPAGWRLAYQAEEATVGLLQLLDDLPAGETGLIAIGLDFDGQVVSLDLRVARAGGVLVAGGRAAGKTNLLRVIGVSLALTHSQSALQLAVVEAAGGPGASTSLYPLNYLPHLQFPVASAADEAEEALRFLAGEAAYRQEHGIQRPLLVVLLDDVDRLLARSGGRLRRPLAKLLQDGPEAGLRVVASFASLSDEWLGRLVRHSGGLRFTGQAADADEARRLSGVPDSQAEFLRGWGEFLALTGGRLAPFQAAHLDDYDLHLALTQLTHASRPALLALPLPTVEAPSQPFHFDGERVELNEQTDGAEAANEYRVEPGAADAGGGVVYEPDADFVDWDE